MRILVAVTNCWIHRKRQEAIRNTWLKDVPPTMDVRFFLGRTPGTVPPLKDDEVLVDVDDGYLSLPAKTRAMCRYAREHGYDWLFKCDDDTYVQLQRLERSDFQSLGDYIGRMRGSWGRDFPAPYASGFSYWLSRKAFGIIADAQLTKDFAEDRWVGNTLHAAGISCVPDYRYVVIQSVRNALSHTEGPRAGNDVISACEFDAESMHKIHSEWQDVKSVMGTHQKDFADTHPLHKVCIVIKTFLRDEYLTRCIAGIQQRLPECKIVTVDDGLESKQKITFYAKLRQQGHVAVWLPFRSGLGAKANEAVKHCDREYVLIGSDDLYFGRENVRGDVTRMVQTLEQVPDLDIVSGCVNNERQRYHSEENCAAGVFKRCDLASSFSLIRRPFFDRVHWDNDVEIGGERGMFFLDVKRAEGKVASLPGVNITEFPRGIGLTGLAGIGLRSSAGITTALQSIQ